MPLKQTTKSAPEAAPLLISRYRKIRESALEANFVQLSIDQVVGSPALAWCLGTGHRCSRQVASKLM
ncbi:MAG: hypothetical protein C5B49_13510 [Bdellovibrio sp.]|nr:MAG: hypothetical protein C5B49_13510 [Bdellovibrio sp.]